MTDNSARELVAGRVRIANFFASTTILSNFSSRFGSPTRFALIERRKLFAAFPQLASLNSVPFPGVVLMMILALCEATLSQVMFPSRHNVRARSTCQEMSLSVYGHPVYLNVRTAAAERASAIIGRSTSPKESLLVESSSAVRMGTFEAP